MPETNKIICGNCLEVMEDWPDNCVDLVFGSPPYEDARTYGIDIRESQVELSRKRIKEEKSKLALFK